jgi:hypothetical protein
MWRGVVRGCLAAVGRPVRLSLVLKVKERSCACAILLFCFA